MALPATLSLPQSGSIVSRWKLNEASGSRADSVGSNTLTDNNTVTAAAGQFGENAADFEKDNSEYLSIADGSQSGLDLAGNFTFSVWINLESAPATNALMSYFTKWGSTAATESYLLEYVDESGTKKFRYVLENSSGQVTVGTKAYTMSTSTWYLVTIVVTPATPVAKLYINGASQGNFSNSSSSATSIRNGTGAFNLGRREAGINYFDGLLQDGVLWSLALSDAEVTALYDAYFAPSVTEMNLNRTPIRGVGRGIMRP
jgi:hypothetical protein